MGCRGDYSRALVLAAGCSRPPGVLDITEEGSFSSLLGRGIDGWARCPDDLSWRAVFVRSTCERRCVLRGTRAPSTDAATPARNPVKPLLGTRRSGVEGTSPCARREPVREGRILPSGRIAARLSCLIGMNRSRSSLAERRLLWGCWSLLVRGRGGG